MQGNKLFHRKFMKKNLEILQKLKRKTKILLPQKNPVNFEVLKINKTTFLNKE